MTKPRGDDAVHGGAGALKAREQGKPFAGLAAERAHEIGLQLTASGPDDFIRQDAIAFQTIADLYLDAIKKASETGDQSKVDGYVKVWTWVAAHALRSWLEVRKLSKHDDAKDAAVIINQYRQAEPGKDGNE